MRIFKVLNDLNYQLKLRHLKIRPCSFNQWRTMTLKYRILDCTTIHLLGLLILWGFLAETKR